MTQQGCLGYRTDGPDGYDYECGYDTIIDCDECKYSKSGGRKDPAAKRNSASLAHERWLRSMKQPLAK